jgi:hypothetical protein
MVRVEVVVGNIEGVTWIGGEEFTSVDSEPGTGVD